MTAAKNQLPKLNPKRTMGRNELCWCQSGKKWKNCHRDRESLSRVNVFEAFAEMDEEYAKGYCLHPDAAPHECSDIVQAHSNSKAWGVGSYIRKKSYPFHKQAGRRLPDKNGTFEPARLGVNKASTFPEYLWEARLRNVPRGRARPIFP